MSDIICKPRSREALRELLESFRVETAEKYRRRDVTGDGLPETFCNLLVQDVTRALECPVPICLANTLVAWLDEAGATDGWKRVEPVLAAEGFVNLGKPVIVGWANPGGHGHVAIGSPSDEPGLHVAQAGSINFTCRPVGRGFGKSAFCCWVHE